MTVLKNMENNGTEEIGLVTPTIEELNLFVPIVGLPQITSASGNPH